MNTDEKDAYNLGFVMGKHDQAAGEPYRPDGAFVRPGPLHSQYSRGYLAGWKRSRLVAVTGATDD